MPWLLLFVPFTIFANKTSCTITLSHLKAFPTAVGVGAHVTGGRYGDVVYVTRLDGGGTDDTNGTLFAALNSHKNRPRTILFAVGGHLDTTYKHNKNHQGIITPKHLQVSGASNFTIAGQSAHGLGGIHLLGNVIDGEVKNFSGEGLTDTKRVSITKSNNFSIRYISAKGPTKEPDFDAKKVSNGAVMDLQRCNDVIIDHFSGGYGSYMLLFNKHNPTTKKAGNFTLQNSLAHEGWSEHNIVFPTGFPYSDANKLDKSIREEAWNSWIGKYDIAYNAYILLNHRQPVNSSGGKDGSFILTSNYIYGWGSRLGKHSGSAKLDLINNLFEQESSKPLLETNKKLYKVEFGTNINISPKPQLTPSLYSHGNVVLNSDETLYPLDKKQHKLFTNKSTTKNYGTKDETVEEKYFRENPQPNRTYPTKKVKTSKVKSTVLANVGAGVRFTESGESYNVDEIDNYYIQQAQHKENKEFKTFTYPTYPAKARDKNGCVVPWEGKAINPKLFDADLDGMPDTWEEKYDFLDKNKADNNGVHTRWQIGNYLILNNAGYTNLEIYLAHLAGDFHTLAKQQCNEK